MDLLVTKFSELSCQLVPLDKQLLTQKRQLLIEDLKKLKILTETKRCCIKKMDRNKLLNAISLLTILSGKMKELSDLILLLQKTSSTFISSNSLAKISNALGRLIEELADANLDFKEQLKLSSFDKFLDDNLNLVKEKQSELFKNGVFETISVYEKQKIRLRGSMKKEDFLKLNIIPVEFIEYEEGTFKERECRDDCIHNGCKLEDLNFDESFEGVYHALSKRVKPFLTEPVVGTGTVGFFLKRKNGKTHYMVTAAHVIFPQLSKLPLDSEEIDIFNEDVDFAIYDKEYDLAIIKCLRNVSHSNTFQVTPIDKWEQVLLKEDLNCTVVKSGQSTGITIGKLYGNGYHVNELMCKEREEYYENLVKVVPNFRDFSKDGDSGSIYFLETQDGFSPIGIHRTTDVDGNGLACNFVQSFKKVLEKAGHLGNFEDYEACSRRNAGV